MEEFEISAQYQSCFFQKKLTQHLIRIGNAVRLYLYCFLLNGFLSGSNMEHFRGQQKKWDDGRNWFCF